MLCFVLALIDLKLNSTDTDQVLDVCFQQWMHESVWDQLQVFKDNADDVEGGNLISKLLQQFSESMHNLKQEQSLKEILGSVDPDNCIVQSWNCKFVARFSVEPALADVIANTVNIASYTHR